MTYINAEGVEANLEAETWRQPDRHRGRRQAGIV
jgi:hypothetical protein